MTARKNSKGNRSGGKHLSISEIHEAALLDLVAQFKEAQPEKKWNASVVFEWMIEKFCVKHYEPLAKFVALRTEMNKLKAK